MPKLYETIGIAIIVALLMGGGYFAYHGEGDNRNSFLTEDSNQVDDLDVDEKLFYQAIAPGTSNDQLKIAKSDLDQLKQKNPEGYWLIIKLGKQFPESFKQGYELNEVFSLSYLLPELNSLGSCQSELSKILGEEFPSKQGLFWEGKVLLLPQLKLSFEQEKVLKRLDNPTEFDRDFFENHPDFFWGCLEELNGWLKGTQMTLAFQNQAKKNSRAELRNLLQRMYYLEVYLCYLRETKKEDWQQLVSEKGVVFMLQRLFYVGSQVAETGRKSKIFREYQLAFHRVMNWQNREVINQLVNEAGIGKLKTLPLTDERLKQNGIVIELSDY